MKSVVRATAILSGSSIVNVLASLVTAKVLALYLMPSGYAYYGLLQNFVAVSSLLAGMGMATGVVRLGAGAVSRGDDETIAALRQACAVIFGIFGGIGVLIVALLRAPLSQFALGSREHGLTIMVMGIALLFTVAGNTQVGILNAYHRVKALAWFAITNAVLTAIISIGSILIWHAQGIVPAVIGGAASTILVSRYFLIREVGAAKVRAPADKVRKSVRALIRFGLPYTASMFMGSGVQLILPMIVLHLLDQESVGYYRAACAISVGYLSFLITAMGQDYYPRVSAAADQPAKLAELINTQQRLVMLLAIPIILGTLAIVPILVPLAYSSKFMPAVEILEWQLIGDLFKFAAATMAIAILARCKTWVYFLTEAVGGVLMMVNTWLGVRFLGFPGLGLSFIATFVIYYFVVWFIIRREIHLVLTPANKRMMAGGFAISLIVGIIPQTRFEYLRTPVALFLAVVTGVPCLIAVWRELHKNEDAAPPSRMATAAAVSAPVLSAAKPSGEV